MSARRVYTEDEVEDLVARAIQKTNPDQQRPRMPKYLLESLHARNGSVLWLPPL